MCSHLYEELVPVYDDGGSIECADGILGCSLLDDACAVLRGAAAYVEEFALQPDGWHRELRYNVPSAVTAPVVDEYDSEIPF